jgi:predicted NBD/HSP70 family sugar kinase
LTPLTGLSAALLEQHGMPLAQALATLRAALPRDAVLVGQNIRADVQWLGLKEGTDFAGMLDLAGLWRVFNAQYSSWSVFGQDHLARVLLGVDAAQCAPQTYASRSCSRTQKLAYARLVAGLRACAHACCCLLAHPHACTCARAPGRRTTR